MVVGTDAEKQVLDAWVSYTAAIKKLRDAATKKFPEKADEVTGAGMNIDSAKALEDSEVKEEGDTARIVPNKPKPGQSDLCLRKVDGKWVPDYAAVVQRANVRDYVERKGVKEVWLWGYHRPDMQLWESNMASRFGDVSNSMVRSSAPDAPSMVAWWTFVSTAKSPPSRPSST